MDDSDDGNIKRVGHRRWCLNPAMERTGFGLSGVFSAMWAFNDSRNSIPDYTTIAYPSGGAFPAELFGERHAWSVQFHPDKFAPLDSGVKASVRPFTDKPGEPLRLDFHDFQGPGYGPSSCLIFRPVKPGIAPGKKYLVEIDGLKQPDGKAVKIQYLVIFL